MMQYNKVVTNIHIVLPRRYIRFESLRQLRYFVGIADPDLASPTEQIRSFGHVKEKAAAEFHARKAELLSGNFKRRAASEAR